MSYPAAWYWGNRLRFGLILTAAVTLSLAPLAWAEPLRELRDCATCPALIEVPAGTFERLGWAVQRSGCTLSGPMPLASTP
jgi:hypothetical protein